MSLKTFQIEIRDEDGYIDETSILRVLSNVGIEVIDSQLVDEFEEEILQSVKC